MTILNKYNLPEDHCKPKWHSDLPSATVPDQSLSVQDLLERFTSGLLTPNSVWHEDNGDDFSDLDNPNPTDRPDFDLVDRDAVMQRAASASRSLEHSRQRATSRSDSPKEAKPSAENPNEE